jgi:hypothetical protein
MKIKCTPEKWDSIIQSYAAYEGSTVQFCRDFGVPQQTLYSQLKRRQVATINKRSFANVKVSTDESSFIKARVPLSNLVLHTVHAKLKWQTKLTLRFVSLKFLTLAVCYNFLLYQQTFCYHSNILLAFA